MGERTSIWVWEELVNGKWSPWEDCENGGTLIVHLTNKYVKQPEPHTPQHGRFRWTEYSPTTAENVRGYEAGFKAAEASA